MSVETQTAESSHDSSTDDRDEYRKVEFEGVIDPDTLDPILRHMTELYAEYQVVINSCGWHIRVADTKNIAMTDIRIHPDDWGIYDMGRGGPIGLSHNSVEEMVDFVSATDEEAHISIEDGEITMSDGDRLFIDTKGIDPDAIRTRPENPELVEDTKVMFDGEQESMWDLKKWVRSNKNTRSMGITVTEQGIAIERDGKTEPFVVPNEPGTAVVGDDVQSNYSMDYLYNLLKKPLKSQLTDVGYTLSFHSTEGKGEEDETHHVLRVTREYDSNSKFVFHLAPRISN